MRKIWILFFMAFLIVCCKERPSGDASTATNISKTEMCMPILKAESGLELIRVSEDGRHFVGAESGERFFAWGFNYDHNDSGRLIEDYWCREWPTVTEDFKEMKALGANVVRIHPQVAKFMNTAKEPNEAALKQLVRLVKLAEETGLYLDITGLGCYHKQDVPDWYDALDETGRWEVQALFWEAVAKNCAQSPAVFCYDLMNEPILPGEEKKENEWLAGEFGGKYFVQRISLDLAGRTRKQVARMWVDKLVAAIRKHDKHHMITVGVIPWAHTFPKAKPLFYSEEVGENFDFVSVHFYPKKGEVPKALTALAVYNVGKPLVIEETSPLWCGQDEFDVFVDESLDIVDGYVGFYWGKTIEEYSVPNASIADSIMRDWLKYFRIKGPEIFRVRDRQSEQ
ncbi:MAG: cellulase family glycosylhydrolase [Sedimentisphaerales bacterium]|nr:cellulase family glycosylhydrolase [Sedimentisphaerales bacterium]